MKKIILFIFCLGSIFNAQSQQNEKPQFTFIKSSIQKLEKFANFSNDEILKDAEIRDRMQKIFLVKDTLGGFIDYDTNFIKLSSILPTEKFELVKSLDEYKYPLENSIIRNIKTNKLYAIVTYSLFRFQDMSNYGNENMGFGYIFKRCPKELTLSEKESTTKLKSLIKNANTNVQILATIQNKYLTKGGKFDQRNVGVTDKKTFNKNLSELKAKAEQINDFYLYEDKNKVAQNKLTDTELVILGNIHTWEYQNIIN